MSRLVAIVLAAGHGTRMKSSLPKVLHKVCGRPLLYYPVRAALQLGASEVVVVVNEQTQAIIEQELACHLDRDSFSTALQAVPRGTGDAARAALEVLSLDEEDRVLILSGDAPLLEEEDLAALCGALEKDKLALAFMSFVAADPSGYGRVLRDAKGKILEIREHRDLKGEAQFSIDEVNAGVYAARAGALQRALAQIRPDNAQGEFYLTDIVALLAEGASLKSVIRDEEVLAGVNDRSQLAKVEIRLFARKRERLGAEGVTIRGAPLVDDRVEVARDVCLEEGVRLRGNTQVGAGSFIDVGSVIEDSRIGEGVLVKPYCVIMESLVGDESKLGPYAHLRPQSVLEERVHIGNFVETKKTLVRKGAKANHLSYLGDAEIGENTNVGAGTIICNYDGYLKSRTHVGKGVFIGSASQLVAPLTVGDGAYVATATTVVHDVPADALAIGRVRQENKLGYASRLKERLKNAATKTKTRLMGGGQQ